MLPNRQIDWQCLTLKQELGTKTVMDILVEKHPNPQIANLDFIEKGPQSNTLPYHPSIYYRINPSALREEPGRTEDHEEPRQPRPLRIRCK